MPKRCKMTEIRFYCPQCGLENFSLPRRDSLKHEKFHRKKLYCYHCKEELDCIEIRNDEELFEFREMFNNGNFTEEVANSLDYVRSVGKW